MHVQIKQHGQEVTIYYDKESDRVLTDDFEDLVLL